MILGPLESTPAKWPLIAFCVLLAYVAVPWYVHWLRHRPHRLTEGTQHIVLAGQLAQVALLGVAVVLYRCL